MTLPTGIKTNGVGKPCDWLNTKTTLADVWRRDPPARPEAGKPITQYTRRGRIPCAGYDPKEYAYAP